jgi:DNA-binding SARP family transcriptional activator
VEPHQVVGRDTAKATLATTGSCTTAGCMRGPAVSWQVRLMGELAVGYGDEHVDGPQVGSRHARILLALLTVEDGRLTPVDRIVDTLWPVAKPRQPVANVATLVSRLRARFDAHLISGGRNGYRLGERVGSDLNTAAELVKSAEACLAAALIGSARTAADQALRLMHDEVLPELGDAIWVMAPRARRLSLQRRAWHASAEASWRVGEPWAAIAIAETAIAVEPLDQTACRTLMRAYEAVGEPALALRAYERLRTALVRDLGVDPAPPTRAAYLAILRERAFADRS